MLDEDTSPEAAMAVYGVLSLCALAVKVNQISQNGQSNQYLEGTELGSKDCLNMTNFSIPFAQEYANSYAQLANQDISFFKLFFSDTALQAGQRHGKIACRRFKDKKKKPQ